ncbi:glycosyl hydrolase family 8 [Rhizobium sp. SL86]|uniref:glycosyl hydrolase family 8 n=1 Tax=Rhizobium sp. SL86 TaxID=2995148 RepID=UPI0022740916|nr:glycosyl hydrolase family 8 [Rhizobium sp. SL86]MCY1669035.1 glycosyl hydrolase family 8 [Rhizobium sp. SL86]
MMALKKLIIPFAAMMLCLGPPVSMAQPSGGDNPAADLASGAWELYRHKFVTGEGRVIDNKAGDISHSESQGYGMLMAVIANDRRSFESIWKWTRANLMTRDDALASWRWDGSQKPHVKDKNNATDGDLLIAWALLRASKLWGRADYKKLALQIAQAITAKATLDTAYGKMLMPGVHGFKANDQPDGPIVNLSYWVFPALNDLGLTSEAFPARPLLRSGLSLMREARFGPAQLPPDWISLSQREPRPAKGYPSQFGYDAIRVPLYLAWYSAEYPELLEVFARQWRKTPANGLAVVELATATQTSFLTDAGYKAVAEVVECSLGRPLNVDAISNFTPTDYYPSTLHVLSLMVIAERYPTCLTGSR